LNEAKLNVKTEPTNFNLPPSSYNEENRAVNAYASRVLSSDYTGGMIKKITPNCFTLISR
jgi:cytoskeleton-associated protein 5